MNLLPGFMKIMFLMLLLLVPETATACVCPMKLSTRVVLEPGRLAAISAVTNTGEKTVYNVSVTYSLAEDTRRLDPLGDIPGSKRRSQRVEFDLAGLKPGRYVLVTRLDYHEQNGVPHRIHSFRSFLVTREESGGDGVEGVREVKIKSTRPDAPESKGLPVTVDIPPVRRKVLGSVEATLHVKLANMHPAPVQPVISLQLPDGVTADRDERVLDMGPGEEHREEIRLTVDGALLGGHPVSVLVRHRTEGEHGSCLLRTTLVIENSTDSFSAVMAGAVVLLIASSAVAFFAFRRRSACPSGKAKT